MITSTSRFSAIIEIEHHDNNIRYRDRYFSSSMNMWRDLFPENLHSQLLGKSVGEKVATEINLKNSDIGYSAKNIYTLHRNKLADLHGTDSVFPAIGRFYPQNILSNLPGVFKTSLLPCRLLSRTDDSCSFDLNHPMAQKTIHYTMTLTDISSTTKERGGRCEDWLTAPLANGPGMQCSMNGTATEFFTIGWNAKKDSEPDGLFYTDPRLVQHLDSRARSIIEGEYSRYLGDRGKVLDIMASWDSHLPENRDVDLTVLGLNSKELAYNKLASTWLTQDLNQMNALPFDQESYDLITCTASVEYLTQPKEVFTDIARILKKGGYCTISFSNRWFPTKAIQLWSELHDFEKMGYVIHLFKSSGKFDHIEALSVRGYPRPEDDPHQEYYYSDPVFLVSARKA